MQKGLVGLYVGRRFMRRNIRNGVLVKQRNGGTAEWSNGGVGTQDGGYLNKVPLPRAPLIQSTAALMTGNPATCYLQVPRIPTWSDLARSHIGAIRSTMLPLAPRWLM